MSHTFSLGEFAALRSLQSVGQQFDLERSLLWPHTPMAAALSAPFPFTKIGADTFVAYSNDKARRPVGVLQARRSNSRPECTVCFIAPALEAATETAPIWYRLLNDLTNEVGERGVQRVLVRVPNDTGGAEDVLRQSGFATYTHEDIYRLEGYSTAPRDKRLRRQRRRDAWNLTRLYNETTPRPVQQVEATRSGEDAAARPILGAEVLYPPGPDEGSGYVLEEDDLILGAISLTRGAAAYWLRLLLPAQPRIEASDFIQAALSLLHAASPRPVYIPVRDYQSGLQPALQSMGLAPFAGSSLMVKHTTARVKEPVPQLVPALENSIPMAHVEPTRMSRKTSL